MPVSAATERTLRWVALLGRLCSTRLISPATCPWRQLRGRPGRNSSCRPTRRRAISARATCRPWALLQPRRCAIAVLLSPAAAHSTILARATIACGDERDAANAESCVRPSALSTSAALGLPIAIGASP